MAGLVLEVAGEIPEVNRVITINEFDFTIVEVSRNRITRIRVTIKASGE